MQSSTSGRGADAPAARRRYGSPSLTDLGSLSRVTLAGMGTIAENGYFYNSGAMSCMNPMTMATDTMKYPCG